MSFFALGIMTLSSSLTSLHLAFIIPSSPLISLTLYPYPFYNSKMTFNLSHTFIYSLITTKNLVPNILSFDMVLDLEFRSLEV